MGPRAPVETVQNANLRRVTFVTFVGGSQSWLPTYPELRKAS